jgi:hypothetical protein
MFFCVCAFYAKPDAHAMCAKLWITAGIRRRAALARSRAPRILWPVVITIPYLEAEFDSQRGYPPACGTDLFSVCSLPLTRIAQEVFDLVECVRTE